MTTDMRIVFYVPILYSVCGRASVVTSDYLEYIRIEGIWEVSREEELSVSCSEEPYAVRREMIR